MLIYNAIATIEATVQDAQKVIGRGRVDDDVRFNQLRIELDGVWNALKLIATELDSSPDKRPEREES